jgi:magnesium-transporting ATPase (P-type)
VLATVIPPLLPTVFVVSVGISANRLQQKRIACTNPEVILVAGKVDAAFFDKTGTLTKQGLDFLSVDASSSSEELIFLAMAVCHTLGTASDGGLVGNQVDKISFESTGATLHQTKGAPTRVSFRGKGYKVLKHFEFDCHRTTQSVIIEDDQGMQRIFVKGSSESIERICDSSSIPESFEQAVRQSAKSGTYQIAIASRPFDFGVSVADVTRDDIEASLVFAGFVSFQNRKSLYFAICGKMIWVANIKLSFLFRTVLREETPGVLQELEEGEVMSTMITGDSVLTGIFMARQSGMIKENKTVVLGRIASETELEWIDFDSDVIVTKPSLAELPTNDVDIALTGDAWSMLLEKDPKYASLISKHVRVFGRCKPGDKVSVVATFVANGYKTLMCGDGQNDCGSLKTAHVGVALSTAEASLVAPFTSLDKSITSVTEVLREGRCALASALATYSYYIIYGQTESVLQVIAAYLSVTFTEWCWVFYDGIWSITMAFSLPLSKASGRLTPRRPTDSLLGPETMFGVCGILSWNFLFLVLSLVALWNQDWFSCRMWNSEDVSNVLTIGDNYETEVLFVMGAFQYISSAMVLNFGYSFRQGWCKNYVFVFLSCTWMIFVFIMTIYPSSFSCIWRVNCDNKVNISCDMLLFFQL